MSTEKQTKSDKSNDHDDAFHVDFHAPTMCTDTKRCKNKRNARDKNELKPENNKLQENYDGKGYFPEQ